MGEYVSYKRARNKYLSDKFHKQDRMERLYKELRSCDKCPIEKRMILTESGDEKVFYQHVYHESKYHKKLANKSVRHKSVGSGGQYKKVYDYGRRNNTLL